MKKAIFTLGTITLLWFGSASAVQAQCNGHANAHASSQDLPQSTVVHVVQNLPEWFKVQCAISIHGENAPLSVGRLIQAYRGGCLDITPLGGNLYLVSVGDAAIITVSEL